MEYELLTPVDPRFEEGQNALLLGWLWGLTQTLGPHLTLWCGAQNEKRCREVVSAGKLGGITVQVHPYLSEHLFVGLTLLEHLTSEVLGTPTYPRPAFVGLFSADPDLAEQVKRSLRPEEPTTPQEVPDGDRA